MGKTGIEPPTFWLEDDCSNWATAAHVEQRCLVLFCLLELELIWRMEEVDDFIVFQTVVFSINTEVRRGHSFVVF